MNQTQTFHQAVFTKDLRDLTFLLNSQDTDVSMKEMTQATSRFLTSLNQYVKEAPKSTLHRELSKTLNNWVR